MSATLSLWRCSHSNSMEKFSLSLEKRKKLFCLYYFSPRINIPQKTFKPTAKKGTEKTTFNQTFSRLGRFPFLHNSPRRPTLRHGETFFDWWILIRMKNKWRKRKASERYWRKIRRAECGAINFEIVYGKLWCYSAEKQNFRKTTNFFIVVLYDYRFSKEREWAESQRWEIASYASATEANYKISPSQWLAYKAKLYH